MATLHQRTPYQAADAQRLAEDVEDQDEEAMANDFREQVRFDDGIDDMEHSMSMGGQMQDMQAQLLAASAPLDYQATLETKFASYDSYCHLFHYVLNSDGPVDIEAPSVGFSESIHTKYRALLMYFAAFLGMGCYR